jgi:hypothetical protein
MSGMKTADLEAQLDRVRQKLYGMRREHLTRLGTAGAAIVSLLLVLHAAVLVR